MVHSFSCRRVLSIEVVEHMKNRGQFMDYSNRILIRCGLFVLSGTLLLPSGCGGISADVQEAQEAQVQQMYEEATINPPNMSPEAARRRKERVEMDFGVVTDVAKEKSKKPK